MAAAKRWTSWQLAGLVLAIGGHFVACRGHCDVAAPQAPVVLVPPPAVQDIPPPRWSWLHWWEANCDPYLTTLRQSRPGQFPDQKALDENRRKAVGILLAATKSPTWQLRAAAVSALGRMAEKTALDVLVDQARNDPRPEVKQAAAISVGLLDTQAARDLLLGEVQTEPAAASLGLMTALDADVLAPLQQTAAKLPPASGAVAIWALRHRADPAVASFANRVISSSDAPYLVCEAVLTLGGQAKPDSIPLLADILLNRGTMRQLPVWTYLYNEYYKNAHLQQQYQNQTQYPAGQLPAWPRQLPSTPASTPGGAATTRPGGVGAKPVIPNPEGLPIGPVPRGPVRPLVIQSATQPAAVIGPTSWPTTVFQGLPQTYLAHLRGCAAIALGNIDHPQARQALLAALQASDDTYSDLYKAHVIMSLGRNNPDERVLRVLIEILSPKGGIRSKQALDSPLRGYAALALGLYARPVETPQGPQDRPGYDRGCEVLGRCLGSMYDPLEVRAACAVALGLSARTENLRYLQRNAYLSNMDELLVGYVLLGRGMLGDGGILEPAKALLAAASERTDTSGILSRRATVLGLGLLGKEETIPILRQAWHLNYYVNREVIRALSFCDAANISNMVIDIMTSSKDPLEQAYMALCLGELFSNPRPTRLRWFLNGSNYMVKNDAMVPYESMANEFLMRYLIPQFGDQWQ